MISYLADLLKVGNENAQKLKNQREDEAKAEIEQIFFKDKINAFKTSRDNLGVYARDSIMDDDGFYRFIADGSLSELKRYIKNNLYPIASSWGGSLGKTFALFRRYGGDETSKREFIGATVSKLEKKYENAIQNTKKHYENARKFSN